VLALFNMVPVPPLDGGNVLAGLLQARQQRCLVGSGQYGFIVIYVLMLSALLWEGHRSDRVLIQSICSDV
jgi:Zn-dependent protease